MVAGRVGPVKSLDLGCGVGRHGQTGKGHGLCNLNYIWQVLETV